MTLVAHCIGLTDQEIESIKNIETRAGVRIITQNGLTVIKAKDRDVDRTQIGYGAGSAPDTSMAGRTKTLYTGSTGLD